MRRLQPQPGHESERELSGTTRPDEETTYQTGYYSLISNDFIKAIVDQYNLEIKAGVNLIKEYWAMIPYTLTHFEKNDKGEYISKSSILEMGVHNPINSNENKLTINNFVKSVRYKYWKTLFDKKEFTGKHIHDHKI
jgi:hypothetical protein